MNKDILKQIHIKDHHNVLRAYRNMGYEFVFFQHRRDDQYKNKIQYGGGKTINLKLKFEGYVFSVYQHKSAKGYDISIMRYDSLESPEHCMHIDIDVESDRAVIQNISYYKECSRPMLGHPGGGGILLRLALYLLKHNKEKLRIKKVELMDNSSIICGSKKIQLPLLKTLTTGETWYGKYGFKPFNSGEEDEDLMDAYNQNYKIVHETKVKDTPLFDYLEEIIDDKTYEECADMYLDEFFNHFLKDFDDRCEIFEKFYRKFARKIGIYNFYNNIFYLDL